MKELTAILKARAETPGESMALATIVKTVGSSYRRAGAHMLVRASGEIVGSVSGGCLEQDVIAHAQKVIASGQAKLLSYDTTPEEDVLLGTGLGCNGLIEIWVEPMARAAEMLDFIENIFANDRRGVIAHVFRGGDFRREFFHEGGDADSELAREAQSILASGRSVTRELACAEVFFEIVQAPTRLYVFGAGYDALPLVSLAAQLGFRVTVVDLRPAYASTSRFPQAEAVIVGDSSCVARMNIPQDAAAVVMAHRYVTDRDFVKALLRLPIRYLGILGPRRRAETMLQEIRAEGVVIGDDQLRKVHNPVGLDIGAEGPEQIALAVLAEITTVFNGHNGGLLRDKKGPIHSPRELMS